MSSASRPAPFWLCHECGAQMRPISVDGVQMCAACQGEFIEILDLEVNPDPFAELPPPPPVRPSSLATTSLSDLSGRSEPRTGRSASSPPLHPQQNDSEGGFGGIIGSMMNLFGGGPPPQANTPPTSNPNARPQDVEGQGERSRAPRTVSGGRSFTFNFPGGGVGSVVIGGSSFGGANPSGPNAMHNGDPDMGLEHFFPGFGAAGGATSPFGQNLRPNPPPFANGEFEGPEFVGTSRFLLAERTNAALQLTALLNILADDGVIPSGSRGNANLGDYAMSQRGFDEILEGLMQVAGPQGPTPAPDIIIDGLPRAQFDEKSLRDSAYKDCPVCKDDFVVGDKFVKVPCTRFSLLPEDDSRPRPAQPSNDDRQTSVEAGGPATNPITNLLSLFRGNPNPPRNDQQPSMGRIQSRPSGSPTRQPSSGWPRDGIPSQSPSNTDATSGTAHEESTESQGYATDIPEDYRQRHRERERQAERERDRARENSGDRSRASNERQNNA
ncbi:hypothetical protein P7C73_g1296, partial [Tremellales sp. Uapishka_1]